MRNVNQSTARRHVPGRLALLFGLLVFAQSPLSLSADNPVLSDTPIANTTSVQVKPNIMLLMDTSSSMKFSHMPDEIEGSNNGAFPIGYKSYQCNVMYYKPSQVYVLPKDSTGASLPLPAFGAAFYNVYTEYVENPPVAPSTLVNLGTSFRAYDTTTRDWQTVSDPAQPAYYYIYTTAGGVEPSSLNFAGAPCTDVDTGVTKPASSSGTWTRVLVSTLTAAEQNNFAIWYSYYRTRISMIKSAVSLSFTPLTDSYRVGLITVKPYLSPVPSPGDAVAAANYLAINDFEASQRQAWFKKLFNQLPGGSSPTREGLARVGRHYAGKQDSINLGMTGDPVQYSCQQNFTILTTDGYWNTAAETLGPVKLDGVSLVGQQDGSLNQTKADPNSLAGTINIVPRPIWDGYPDTTRVTTAKTREYSFDVCTSLYGPSSTLQVLENTTQRLQSTSQMKKSTTQNLASYLQRLENTTQRLQSTSQMRETTTQNLASYLQRLENTTQRLRSTTQNVLVETQNTTSTQQTSLSTSRVTRTRTQIYKTTSQSRIQTSQNKKTTTQNLVSTTQNLRATAQITSYTRQYRKSTVQNLASTVQNRKTTAQILQTMSQVFQRDAATELTTPVASCTPGGTITCIYPPATNTSNVPVASCTPQTGQASNLFLTITCSTVTQTNIPVQTCTDDLTPTAGNSYTTTTCSTNNTTNVPVPTCTNTAANAGNNWTTTTCSTNNTTNQPALSCSATAADAGNSYTTTSCPTAVTTPVVGVQTCTGIAADAGNAYTATICGTNNTGPTPVQSCPANIVADAGNQWTTTTCSTNNTTNQPAASCTATVGPAVGPNWITTTCPAAVTTGPTVVSACTGANAPAAASSANSWTTTTCAPEITGPTAIDPALCSYNAPTAGNNWTETTCPALTTGSTTNWVDPATCTTTPANAGNSWTSTTCTPFVTGPTAVSSCAYVAPSAGNSWRETTCNTITTGPTPVATCSTSPAPASVNNYTTRTCNTTVLTAPTVTASCSYVAPAAGNGYVETVCGVITNNTPVQTCPATFPPPSAPNWITTTCGPVTTPPAPVQTCTDAVATAPNWITVTCSDNNATNTPVASCTPSVATAPLWITRTCPVVTPTVPVPVQTCTNVAPIAGNDFRETICSTNNTTNLPVETCTNSGVPTASPWITTTCNPVTTTNVPVQSCTPTVGPAVGPDWITTTCADNNATNTPVASCTPSGAPTASPWITRTCPVVTPTVPVPVQTCSNVAPIAGNNYTETICSTNNTTNLPVETCTNSGVPTASPWITTTCNPVTTTNVPVQSCTPTVGPAVGPDWITTTCADNNATNTPVASCTPSGAPTASPWITRTCPVVTPVTTAEVYNCQPIAASAANNYTSTSCGPRLQGKELRARMVTTETTTILSGTTITSGPSTSAPSYSPPTGYAATDNICVPDASVGTPPIPALVIPPDGSPTTADIAPTPAPASTASTTYTLSCAGAGSSWPCTLETVTNAGSYNSLADVAQYYYTTDLRTGTAWDSNLSATPVTKNDNVPAAGTGPEDDSAPWQHMTTYTVALGVSGTKTYSKTYKDDPSGDFADLRSGAKSWPIWPDTTLNFAGDPNLYSDPRSIDDIWHTAVNGRGRYFSAGKPSDVVDGLRAVLNDLGKKQGSGAAAASSSQTPVQGNNIAYVAKYATTSWAGDIEAREIDLTNGQVKSTVLWSAQSLLDAKAGYYCDGRNIYLFRSGATNNMVDFKWNTGTCSTQTIPAGNAPATPIPASSSVVVAADAIVVKVTKDTVTYPFPAVLTATAQTGVAAPRDLIGGSVVLAGDTIVTSAGVTVTLSVPASTTVATAGTVAAVSRDTTTYPSPFVLTASAKTGAGAARAINAGDPILAGDVVVTTAGVTVKIEHVVSPTTGLNAAEQANFGSGKIALLSQYPDMSDGTNGNPDQRSIADDDNLVNFVRGHRGREGFVAKDPVKLYRKRDSILGDFVNAQPIFVQAPFASYTDTGYQTFKSAQANRKAMIYAAANDGMLHAFYGGVVSVSGGVTSIDSTGGHEAWAFMPSTVLSSLYKLADFDYANRHTFLVDGTPSVGDVYDSAVAAWKTVLVAGLNKGGKTYYALDVTDPDAPKALWEFNWSATCYDKLVTTTHGADCDLGYTFGKPVITKLKDGTWVALVTSGYNNVSGSSGDGRGFLYVLNVMTGKIISKIDTGFGDATTPSGLAQMTNFVDNALVNNTTKYVYAGDNSGNVFRFGVYDDPATLAIDEAAAVRIGVTLDSAGVAQPITTRPELGEIGGKPWIFVGTGRLLGLPDLTDVRTQSVYAFIDPMGVYTTDLPDPLAGTGGLRDVLRPLAISPKTASNATPAVNATRSVACTGTTGATGTCARKSGWVVDLPDDGERINVDMSLVLGTLVFASNIPRNTACEIGGYSWLNFLDFRTGLAVSGSTSVSAYLGTSLAVGLSILRLPSIVPGGQGRIVASVMGSGGVPQNVNPPVSVLPPIGRRVSWRELLQ